MSSIVLTQATSDPKIAMATLNSSLPSETAIPTPPEQGVVEKKKKKAIAKKVKRKVRGSSDESSDQE